VVTVQGDAGGTPIPVSVSHISLATDAATETTLATLLKESTFTGRVPTLGQHAAASSWSVVLASDQATIPVSTASLPLPVGAATETEMKEVKHRIEDAVGATKAAVEEGVVPAEE
jgi:hypothetical protein